MAVVRIPFILSRPVVILKSPLSLPLTIEYLVLAFGDPNSSLSVTFSVVTSTPISFSGTNVDIWGEKGKKLSRSSYFNVILKYLGMFF